MMSKHLCDVKRRRIQPRYTLYWSPEGRPIATVEAKTERQAIRKAPKPYRRYLGEIYAVKGPRTV